MSTYTVSSLLHFFFLYCCGDPRDLHSFPTRRSSDLPASPRRAARWRCDSPPRSRRRRARHRSTGGDRKSTRLNSSHRCISYAVFCLKKKKQKKKRKEKREVHSVIICGTGNSIDGS